MRDHIYKPYVDELLAIEKAVDPLLLLSATTPHRRSAITDFQQYLESKLRNLVALSFQLLDIDTGRAFFVFRGKAY